MCIDSLIFFSEHNYFFKVATDDVDQEIVETINMKNKDIDSKRNKIKRLQKRVKTLRSVLKKAKSDLDGDAYVQLQDMADNLPTRLNNLVKTKEETGKNSKYDEQIKIFAVSLFMRSARAYRMVRKSFSKCLPAERTIKRWMQKVDASPGFNKRALNYIKQKAENCESMNQKLLLSFTLDEMAIKKQIQFTGIKDFSALKHA